MDCLSAVSEDVCKGRDPEVAGMKDARKECVSQSSLSQFAADVEKCLREAQTSKVPLPPGMFGCCG